nr:cytosolic iron-sulfur assembly component 1 [Halisarca dujardinii]
MSASLECIATLEGHKERVWNVSWNPSGSLLASCGGDKTIRLWGLEGDGYVCKGILGDGHQRTVRSVSWSPCGRKMASASFDATVGIWENKSGEFEQTATLEGHENEVKSTCWSPNGALLASCSRDKSVWIWEVIEEDDDFECKSVIHSHTQDVKCVKWHPSEDMLASCSYDDTVKVYKEDVDDWSSFQSLDGHSSTVWAIDFSGNGDRLASCSADKTVKIWKCYKPGNALGVQVEGQDPKWMCICTLTGYHSREIYDISWSQGGQIVTGCGDDYLRVFEEDPSSAGSPNAPTFNQVCSVERAHGMDINGVSWHPKQHDLLASCSDDGTVKIWRFRSAS